MAMQCQSNANSGINIMQIGPVVFEKKTKISENGPKKCLLITGSDFGEFSISNPT